MNSWDKYFIEMAVLVSTKSKDPSTKVGCVIVGPDNEIRSTGFNGFPRGVAEMSEAPSHLVVAVEYMASTYDSLTARCSCGEIVRNIKPLTDSQRVGQHKTMEQFHMAAVVAHEHFGRGGDIVLSDRWERPAKYEWVEHAERNAVYNAARIGASLKGCRAYLNWESRPCIECTKAFIQAGIVEIIGPAIPFPSGGTRKDWKFEKSVIMLNEAQVKFRDVPWAS